jgi:hypothetical protein
MSNRSGEPRPPVTRWTVAGIVLVVLVLAFVAGYFRLLL